MEKKTILLVEDEAITALNIHQKLEEMGYTVPAIVSTGEEAVRLAAKLRPDRILMDIMLKGEMNGIEAAQKIMTLNIPVVYLTAYTDEETVTQATQKPSYGYIVKPYQEKELKTSVEIALNKHLSDQKRMEKVKEDILLKKDVETIKKQGKSYDGSKPKIMIVEDESITAMDIASKLRELGYEVVDVVDSGSQAIKNARKISPDLILTDIMLKGDVNGINVAESIKDLDIPVVYLTAYADGKVLERAKLTSPYGYIIKPYQEEELKTTIEMALHKHQADQLKIKDVVEKLTTKEEEFKIEKAGVIIVSAIILSLVAYGIITWNMTWLEYLLFISAAYGLFLTIFSSFKKSKPLQKEEKPFVSIVIPAHNEQNTIKSCVYSLANLEYVKDGERNYEIIVVDDGSTDNTASLLQELEDQFSFLKVVTRKPPRAGKGKGYVLNDGLNMSIGEIIAVFDADAIVEPDFLNIIIPYVNEEGVAGVQSRVKMYNKDENLLTSMQEVEFSVFGDVLLKARDRVNGAAFLGGNGQITRRDAVEALKGWDGYAITEDLNMSIKLMINGWKIRYCGEAVVYQEAVPYWKPFFRQRIRWAMGNLETLFVYFTSIIRSDISLFKKLDALYYLSTIILNSFVMIGYIIFVLYLTGITIFSLTAPLIVVLLSTVAFFPIVISGTWHDSRKITTTLSKSLEYWLHCFYLVPLFFAAFIGLLTRKERKWAKTHHLGESKVKLVMEKEVI